MVVGENKVERFVTNLKLEHVKWGQREGRSVEKADD